MTKATVTDFVERKLTRIEDTRQVVRLVSGQLHNSATLAEQALVTSGAPIYVRGGNLVRPVVDVVDTARGRRTETARLKVVTLSCLIDHLSRAARFERLDLRSKEWRTVDPPDKVAETILSRDGEWLFPPVAGVVTTPTMRPDGSLLTEAGYDPATRLLLVDPPALPAMPTEPTRTDALKALAILNQLLGDFPFVDDASRSVALSALMTPVVRGAMLVAPMHAMRAPTAGSGKSYLVDLAAAISTGQVAPVMAAGKTAEELEKRLSAAMLASQSIIAIDNVNGELGGDALCQLVERPSVAVRLLGRSELASIESRATVFATGNNIALVGDMTRRVLVCSLDPNLERPELRQFTRDPFGAVTADRGRYIAAVLTICRAYSIAGSPDPCPALASFGDWSRIVRSALVWLDCADPVDTMELARVEDPEAGILRSFIAAWYEADAVNHPLSAGQIVEIATAQEWTGDGEYHSPTTTRIKHPALHEAALSVAADRSGAISPLRLGKWLARHKGRITDGLKITGDYDRHDKLTRWRLEVAR